MICAYYFFCLTLIKNYTFPPLFSITAGFLIFLLAIGNSLCGLVNKLRSGERHCAPCL